MLRIAKDVKIELRHTSLDKIQQTNYPKKERIFYKFKKMFNLIGI